MSVDIYTKSSREKLSPYLSVSELRCRCQNHHCIATLVDSKLPKCFDELRVLVGKPLVVTSGYRCQAHNLDVKGAMRSQHLCGSAIDVLLPTGFTLDGFELLAKSVGFTFTKQYPNPKRIHMDLRKK